MRTTLTLDDDVAAMIRRVQGARGEGLREVVNAGLRVGLAKLLEPEGPARRHHTRGEDLGACLIGSLDDVSDAIAVAEGEGHR